MTLFAKVRNPFNAQPTAQITIWESPISKQPVSRIANGTSDLMVLNVQDDPTGEHFNNITYKWFELQLPDNLSGWVRDDYVHLSGNGMEFGFGVLDSPVSAFTLIHTSTAKPDQPPEPPVSPVPAPDVTEPESPAFDRILLAAFNITTAFEGDYASYQTIDAGIISYGRFQFTLAGGALFSVVDRYLQLANSATAQEIKTKYIGQIQERDISLQTDSRLKELLTAAANESEMRLAQNKIAEEKYWNLVQTLSIQPRNIQSALGQAMLFDMGINHGACHNMLTTAEEMLGVDFKSRVGENGTTEELFIKTVAEIRRERMYKFADANNFPGLKPRVDFWVKIIADGDWDLQGNDAGEVLVKTGLKVQVRNP